MPRITHLLTALVLLACASAAFSRTCDFEDFAEHAEPCEPPRADLLDPALPTAERASRVLSFAKYAGALALAASAANESIDDSQDDDSAPESNPLPTLSSSLARELASPESPFGERIARTQPIPLIDFQNARVLSKMIAGLVLNGKPHTVFWYVGVPVKMIERKDFKPVAETDDYFVIVSETGGSLSLGREIHAKRDFNRYFGLGLR